jgi:Carbohydrate binding module (family 6)/Right handed beta helix region
VIRLRTLVYLCVAFLGPAGAVSAATTPYLGTPAAIPGTVKVENFDNGGQGLAYFDATPGNTGGAYRSGDVDIEVSSAGGYDVGWVSAGEWLKYTVSVAATGTYSVIFTVASQGQGGTFHLEMNGTNVTGPLTVPNTGGWQSWQTVRATASLNAGQQVARLVMDTLGAVAVGNFGRIQFTVAAPTPSGPTPYTGAPAPIPGMIEAENFDNGGAGVAYADSTPGNAGGAYRTSDVDIERSSEGGYDVGWIAAGEWLKYSVKVAVAGNYTLQLRVASPSGASMHVAFNGPGSVSAPVTVPATGGWQTWKTVSVPATLGAGAQLMTLFFDTPGINLNYVSVTSAAGPPPPPPPPPTGTTITVPAGGNLQAAITAARPGDTILLLPGVTYPGDFVLPAKAASSAFITIRSAAADSSLPPAGTRITPASAPLLPRVRGGVAGMPAFMTALGAHHYRLMFLEIVNTNANNDVIELGDGSAAQNTLSSVAHDLIVDRCYIHGSPAGGQKRGIALNSASTSIVNSYISDIKSSGSDSQAIAGWNGPGPFTITNNYLEASGENVMFGGADPHIANLVPSDITLRQNHITKQTSWRTQTWTVKNLIELKNAQRVTIDGNLIENNWAAAQTGYAIMLTPRNQGGTAPWSTVQQLQFTNNVVRHVGGGFDVLGTDSPLKSGTTNAITVRNNLFLDISAAKYGGSGWLLVTFGGVNIVFDHNTVFTDGTSVIMGDGPAVTGFVFTNNIVPDNAWAVMGSGASPGNGAISKYFPRSTFRRNVFIAGNPSTYPADNDYPASVATVQFVDAANGNYALASTSPYRSAATDGTAIGINQAAINALVPAR